MNEDPRPPVAIRITRPYATEEELLQHEPETITRTGVTLLGAQQRPQGVVLRFELALSTGNAVLRGEGRVVAYKPGSQDGLGGLTLRFTRLDSRSKSLVDKATALRDQRRQSLPPPPPGSIRPPPLPSPVSTPPPFAAARRSSLPPPAASSQPAAPPLPPPPPPAPTSDVTLTIDVTDASGPTLPSASSSPALLAVRASSIPPPPPPSEAPRPPLPETHARQVPSLPDRDALLSRLRVRARSLDASQVARILERK